MKVGIAGLGLIGGSLARAYHKSGAEVYGWNRSQVMQDYAKLEGTLTGVLDEQTIRDCDVVFLALYPDAAIAYMEQMAPVLPKSALLMDCCGNKQKICKAGFALAKQYGFTFVGGHPMAGTQFSGYAKSRADLFANSTMIVVPADLNDIVFLDRIKQLLLPVGFAHITVTTAENHDRMIAYTSQLSHILSSAYVKSPCAPKHMGFSAGSYRDLTRVAWMNEEMWTELFLENNEFLQGELDLLIQNLTDYRTALNAKDGDRLRTLLAEGRICKEKADEL
jgi:prephenate dehydrogenase